jgi:hypothetical protein
MNFGKLLATGKSIINGRKAVAYRENPNVYLPKFEPAKNPFARPSTAPAEPAEEAPLPAVAPKVSATPVAVPVPVSPVAATAAPARQANWVSRLNPMAMLRPSAPPTGAGRVEVQTELSLDSVKPVQNDLVDAEVEVVPLKSRPARSGGAGETQESWNDLGAKIFGTNAV